MTALLPVFFMQGLSGAFFQPLAQAYVVATLVSPLVALTVTQALNPDPTVECTRPRACVPHHPLDAPRVRPHALRHCAYTAPCLRSVGILMAAGIFVWPMLGQELLPSFKERDFLMHWLTKPGASHPEMVRISQTACKELLTIEGVRNCSSRIGQGVLMDEVYGIYFGEN